MAVTHKARGVKMVVSPPGSPISSIFRDSAYQLKIGETSKSPEWLGLGLKCL